MEIHLTVDGKRPSETKAVGTEAAVSLQEELIAAIHGAFEVAVEIAVREVSKLVGQATGVICEEMRQENETLKQRLQEAEALLDSNELLNAAKQKDKPTSSKNVQQSPSLIVDTGVSQHEHVTRQKERRSSDEVEMQHVSDASENDYESAISCEPVAAEASEETSVYAMRTDSYEPASQDHYSPPRPCRDHKSTVEQIRVKQETSEEEQDGSSCFLDSIKVEDFSPECMSVVQSKMLEEWKPQVLHNQSEDSDAGPTQEPPPLSSEFPNIFQVAEPVPIPGATSHIYGVRDRTSRNLSNLYSCKYCGQTFHLPSLLRKHYGQCQLRHQQCFQQPVAGSKRARLQLYPPGCSPFRCIECNREFNRMENLKTHLRIHTGERPYTCSVCSKCFRHSGALTRHFRIHTGEKPYICGQCGKSFRNCGGLKFHQRSHSQ